MTSTRNEILQAVRAALADGRSSGGTGTETPTVSAQPETSVAGDGSLIELFAERLAGVSVGVTRAAPDGVAASVRAICEHHHAARVAIPADIPDEWRPDGVELVPEDDLSASDLDGLDGTLTGAAIAIAESATIAFDGGTAQGRRMLTLVPDLCICVVAADQITGTLPQGLERLSDSVTAAHRPLVFMSGPSATSDIEMRRVQGVHGPRLIEVVIVDGGTVG